MKNRTAIKWAQNPALAALLLVAFFSRALIPAGYMPGPGGLIICHGGMPAPAAIASQGMSHDMSDMDMSGMDMSGMDMSQHADQQSKTGSLPDHEGSGFCPFAAAATPMASWHVVTLLSVIDVITPRVNLPPQPFVPRGTIVPTSLPRGPPSLA